MAWWEFGLEMLWGHVWQEYFLFLVDIVVLVMVNVVYVFVGSLVVVGNIDLEQMILELHLQLEDAGIGSLKLCFGML